MKSVIMLGPPGVGKGATSQAIAEALGIPHINTGDLFKTEIKNNTPLGSELKRITDSGDLVSDKIVFDLLKSRLKEGDCKMGFILDGFPRKLSQAEFFDKAGFGKFIVLNLIARDEIIIKRLSSRLVCTKCKRVYNSLSMPPKKSGFCDLCGSPVEQRSDDTKEVIKKRLEVYREETEPLIDYYTEKGIIFDVDSEPKIDVVVSEALSVIEENQGFII